MKITLLLCLLFIVSNVYAQDFNPNKFRFGYQQRHISKLIGSDNSLEDIQSIEQMDQVFEEIRQSWIKFVDDSLAEIYEGKMPKRVLYNLDSYSYYLAFLSTSKTSTNPIDIEYHLLKKYMLPALLIDVNDIKEDIRLQSFQIIWRGNSNNTLIIGSRFYKDKQIITDLFHVLSDIEILLSQQSEIISEETNKMNRRILNSLKLFKYDIRAKYFLAKNEVDKAIDEFTTGVTNQYFLKNNILPFTRELVKYLYERNKKNEAEEVLSVVMNSTFNDEVPRDSLKALYEFIDNLSGESLFITDQQQTKKEFLEETDIILGSRPDEWDYVSEQLRKNKINSAEYILIDFWYSSCKPCIAEIPELNNLNEMIAAREEILFISVNTDYFITERDKSFVSELIEKRGIAFPVAFDSNLTNLSRQLKIPGYPYKTIITKEGKVMQKANKAQITINTFYELLNPED